MTDLSGFTRPSFVLLCILGMSVVSSGFPQVQLPLRVDKAWLGHWSSQGSGVEKRGMVVADDVAFREKSKLLTAMERQKWLNSYMQKILVVNS